MFQDEPKCDHNWQATNLTIVPVIPAKSATVRASFYCPKCKGHRDTQFTRDTVCHLMRAFADEL